MRLNCCDGVRETSVSRWLPRTDPRFPTRLTHITQCPAGIWLRTDQGSDDTAIWNSPSVAIVGARAASSAGLEISRNLGWELASAGVVVVSGLARGIDGAAHEGALLAGGVTVAVLASGVERIYPVEHTELAGRICRRGALISEWGGKAQPLAWRFPRRNRLISGLVDLVVLVEAEARSGAHHTIAFALDQGRQVMAVPRDPVTPGSLGPNRLLADGAPPVLGGQSVLAELAAMTAMTAFDSTASVSASGFVSSTASVSAAAFAPMAGAASAAAAQSEEALAPVGRKNLCDGNSLRAVILQLLGNQGPLTIDQLIHRVGGDSMAALTTALLILEIEGSVRRDSRGGYRRIRAV